MDHNVPTTSRMLPIADDISRRQMEALATNCEEFGITLYDIHSDKQGIVHVIGPEQGFTQPGMTIVCGDSHTATHGAFGALAFGIGTSEVEHVLATQCLPQSRPKTMEIRVDGALSAGVTPKDVILAIIGKIGTDGATGYVVEYTGEAIRGLSMEGRMTICNMSIEAGARAGMIAPDETTFAYLNNRPFAPQGAAWEAAVSSWRELKTDEGATYDTLVTLHADEIAPMVSWGTSPGMVAPITGVVPSPSDYDNHADQRACEQALTYMGLTPGTPLSEIVVDTVFIGSLHERAHRRPARRRQNAGREDRQGGFTGVVRPRLLSGEKAGGSRRVGQNLCRCRFRVARTRLFDVPGHEPGHPPTRRTLRQHEQPQL